jgi:hypothetical protein
MALENCCCAKWTTSKKGLERMGTTKHLTWALRNPVLTFAVIATTATSIGVSSVALFGRREPFGRYVAFLIRTNKKLRRKFDFRRGRSAAFVLSNRDGLLRYFATLQAAVRDINRNILALAPLAPKAAYVPPPKPSQAAAR